LLQQKFINEARMVVTNSNRCVSLLPIADGHLMLYGNIEKNMLKQLVLCCAMRMREKS
jgi:hypothetical protein